MCDPVTMAVASFGIGIVASGVSYMGQMQQFHAAQAASERNAQNAAKATEAQWSATQLRIEQEGAAAAQQKFETNLQTKAAAATAYTAAGEGGVSGLSVDAVLGDIYAKGGRANSAVDSNLQMTRSYFTKEMDVQQAQGQNQINSMPPPEKPSFLPELVNIFGSGINSYSNYKQWTQ